MSSKTKIIVLHMREIIYTVVFAVLATYTDFTSFLYVRTKQGQFQKRLPARHIRRELILLPSL